jgi:DNA-binding NarL/FixJ family response regulator
VRLYIIDDHYLIIEGLYSSFDLESDDFKVIGGSLTLAEALQKISPESIDLIILDLFLQQSNPVSNIRQLRQAFPTIPVVILSQESCLTWQVEMFWNGAKAYLNKTDEKSIIKQRLLQVAAGEIVMTDDVSKILVSNQDPQNNYQLIPDYKDIICELANGMNIEEIAIKMNQSSSSIEKKLNRIRNCFHARTNSELVYKALLRQNPH